MAEFQNTLPIAYFNDLYKTYLCAEESAGGPIERFFVVGGCTIKLCFAGPALVPHVTRALAHLSAEPVPGPALTVFLWDSVSTSTEMPAPAWKEADHTARGEIRDYTTKRIHTAYHLGAYTLNMLDKEMDTALFWMWDAGQMPYYEKGAPLRTILNWWMHKQGGQIVHAAAVGTSKGGVLIAGKGGSGKSTIALTCLDSDLLYAGDDYVLLNSNPSPFIHSVYSSGKADAGHLEQKLPQLMPFVSNSERTRTEKALFFLNEHYSGKIAEGFPAKAILLPRVIDKKRTRLDRVSPAATLTALAPSTLFQLTGAGREDFKNLSEFVRQVPGYVMEVGTELRMVPEVILNLLNGDAP